MNRKRHVKMSSIGSGCLHLDSWTAGQLDTWTTGHMDKMDNCPTGHLDGRKFWTLDIWTFGLGNWTFGQLGGWLVIYRKVLSRKSEGTGGFFVTVDGGFFFFMSTCKLSGILVGTFIGSFTGSFAGAFCWMLFFLGAVIFTVLGFG